jgi:hypothetical protein
MPEGAGFCHKCGTQLPAGAIFCPRCGAAVTVLGPTSPGPQQPPAPWRNEKYEKHEKSEKREKGEKASGGGMLGAVVGGLVLIWLGVTFFFEQNGNLSSDIWWAYFILGVGAILILEGVVIYTRGHYGLGPIIGGAFLIFAGMSAIATNDYKIQSNLWPLAIVVIGLLVLLSGFAFRRRVPTP